MPERRGLVVLRKEVQSTRPDTEPLAPPGFTTNGTTPAPPQGLSNQRASLPNARRARRNADAPTQPPAKIRQRSLAHSPTQKSRLQGSSSARQKEIGRLVS